MDVIDFIKSVGLDENEWDTVLYCLEHWADVVEYTNKMATAKDIISDSD
jgi:hypothetical protein